MTETVGKTITYQVIPMKEYSIENYLKNVVFNE